MMDPLHTVSTMATASNSEQPIEVYKLKNKWNLWAHLPQDPDWTVKGYKKIIQFKTIKEAVGITEMLPEGLIKNCMLFIMREGITPTWEDQRNRNGGCFSYKISNKDVSQAWKELTYVLVGESMADNKSILPLINGITISPKKNFCIVKVWLASCEFRDSSVIKELHGISSHGCLFKEHMPEY